MSLRNGLWLAGVFLVAGCDLFNPYEQPQTETPPAFTEQPPTNLMAAGWPDPHWWENFHSDTLTQLETQAAQHNFDIAAAVARVHQADAQVRVSGAALLPSLEADAGASRDYAHSGSTGTGTGATVGGGSRTVYNANLAAAYELDFWGHNRSLLEEAQAQRDASRYDQQVVALTVSASVADLYFDMLALNERLAVAQDNITNAKKTLDALNKRFKQGLISRLDVAQQENVVAQQNASIAPLQLSLSQDRDAMAVLLGQLPEKTDIASGKVENIVVPPVSGGLPSELLQRRPDVAEAEADLVAAHADINAARADFFPTIDLTASGGYQSAALGSLFNSQGQFLSLGASLAQPIFEGGLLTGELELSKGKYEELEQNYRKSIVAAFADVEDGLAGWQRNTEQMNAQAESVRTAKEAYALSQRQFEGGTVDITSVLDTQRALFSAQDAYLQARDAQLQSAVTLYKVLGGGWQKPAAS